MIGHLDPMLGRAEQHVGLGDRPGLIRDRYRAGGLGGRIASDEDRFGHRELFAGIQAQSKRLYLWLLALRCLRLGGLLLGRLLLGLRLRRRWGCLRLRGLGVRGLGLRLLLRVRLLRLRGLGWLLPLVWSRRGVALRHRPWRSGDHTTGLGRRWHVSGRLGHTRHGRVRRMPALLPARPCRRL